MAEIFLFIIALIWLVFAAIQDLRTTEIANWLSFSLIFFAVAFRFFSSLFSGSGFEFFYQGILGLGVFFILGNLFYYGRLFAGGDAKLMIALGPVLPIYNNFAGNAKVFLFFFLFFFFVGAFYSLVWSLSIGLMNFKSVSKEFRKQFYRIKGIFYVTISLAILFAFLGFFIDTYLVLVALFIFVIPYLFAYAKAVDEICMIKRLAPANLTEGDWLYKDVKIGNRVVKAKWHGLTKEEIFLLRKKHKQVLIRRGIPFSPVFPISFILLIFFGI